MLDPYRAARQLERFLGYGVFERDRPVIRDLPRPEEKGTLVAVITYREVDGRIVEQIEHVSRTTLDPNNI